MEQELTPHDIAALAGEVVHASVTASDLTVGEILETLAPGKGRVVADMLMSAVAAGIEAVMSDT